MKKILKSHGHIRGEILEEYLSHKYCCMQAACQNKHNTKC